jgi:hypothetical protein
MCSVQSLRHKQNVHKRTHFRETAHCRLAAYKRKDGRTDRHGDANRPLRWKASKMNGFPKFSVLSILNEKIIPLTCHCRSWKHEIRQIFEVAPELSSGLWLQFFAVEARLHLTLASVTKTCTRFCKLFSRNVCFHIVNVAITKKTVLLLRSVRHLPDIYLWTTFNKKKTTTTSYANILICP